MRLTVDSAALLAALQAVAPAVAKRTTMPALQCVKLAADEAGLTLTATNTELTCRHAVNLATVAAPGRCLIRADKLASLLGSLGDEPLEVKANIDGVTIKASAGRFDLPALDEAEFPDPPEADAARPAWVVPAGELKLARDRVGFALGVDGSRFTLMAVLFAGTPTGLTATATDTIQAAEATLAVEKCPAEGGKFLVPIAALDAAVRACAGAAVRVSGTKNELTFVGERGSVHTRLIEGRYPPVADVFALAKSKALHTLTFALAPFLAAVRQAVSLADVHDCRLDLRFTPGLVTLACRDAGVSAAGAAEVVHPLAFEGEPVEFAVAPNRLAAFLAAAARTDAEATATFGGGRVAMAWRVGDRYRYLLQPLWEA